MHSCDVCGKPARLILPTFGLCVYSSICKDMLLEAVLHNTNFKLFSTEIEKLRNKKQTYNAKYEV